jgi:uncharacterized protein YbjT (DUF2867 family)
MNRDPMKLAVFGATGGTGRALVQQALARGDEVAALARDPTRAAVLPPTARTVVGDATDAAAVEAVMDGAEAVISCLGAPPSGSYGVEGKVGTYGTRRVLEVMRRLGVKRLVVVSAFGAQESRVRASVHFRVLMSTSLRGIYADKDQMEPLVRSSGMDWTIVRPTNLDDGPPAGRFELDPPGPLGLKARIPREDVAAFLLKVVGDPAFYGRAVTVSSPKL